MRKLQGTKQENRARPTSHSAYKRSFGPSRGEFMVQCLRSRQSIPPRVHWQAESTTPSLKRSGKFSAIYGKLLERTTR